MDLEARTQKAITAPLREGVMRGLKARGSGKALHGGSLCDPSGKFVEANARAWIPFHRENIDEITPMWRRSLQQSRHTLHGTERE
jgi:hypothetical protein